MITVDFDVAYEDFVSDQFGDREVRRLTNKYGGKVVYFQLSGPGGGTPNYGAEFPGGDQVQSFFDDLYGQPHYEWVHHVRPNGSYSFHSAASMALRSSGR